MVATRSALLLVFALAVGSTMAEHISRKARSASKAGVTPIQKVTALLEEMLEKAVKEKEAEATTFSTFSQWCIDTKKVKNDEIKAGQATLEKQEASIEKCEMMLAQIAKRIAALEADIARYENDIKATTGVRNKEKADYDATLADYSESMDAIGRAIVVLKKQSADKAQVAASLLQVTRAKNVPVAVQSALVAFLQQPDVAAVPDQELSYVAPEANAYEFQSGGVVEMLEKLEEEFKKKKMDLVKEEMKAQQDFEVMLLQLQKNIELAQNEISKKTAMQAKHMKMKAATESDKAVTEAELADDTKYLKETTALCDSKTADFESRQALRAEEMETIKKVTELLTSDAVSGASEKYMPSLAQRGAALAQLRNSYNSPELRAKIAAFLAQRATASGSKMLAQLEQRVAAGDPFSKVKKMIQELMFKLAEEATSEDSDKAWCDSELAANKDTRDSKTDEIETLTAAIEGLKASIATLTQELESLTAGIAATDAEVAAATKTRMESKAENEQTIKDAQAAIMALQQALALAKDFYTKAAEATALAQQPEVDAPATFDKPYKGSIAGGSLTDFLEVILTDFTRLESDTQSSEAQEAAEYTKFMDEAKKSKALKETEKKHKEDKKTDSETSLASTEEELKMAKDALEKAEEYYGKLKPKCVDSGITYEDRVKAREEEMQSLQEALKILTGTDI